MQKYNFKEIECVNACNKVNGRFPYHWDLNVYRGCEHGCKYCFALYTHKYMDSKDFFNEIYVKKNITEQLEKLLHSKRWNREVINLGGVTDNYQPAEEKYKIMPEILKLLIKYKTPCIVSTKSDLILRDYDLIDELSRVTCVNVAATITCMDERIQSMIEPNGVSSLKRFEMLGQFKKTKAKIGLHMMPIIPFITDSAENLEALYSMGNQTGVDYAITGILNLRGETKTLFLSFIKESFPAYYDKLCNMYKSGWVGSEYKKYLYSIAIPLMRQYNISGNYTRPIKERLQELSLNEYKQLSLFD